MTDARSSLAMENQSVNPGAYEALVVEGPTPARARELPGGVDRRFDCQLGATGGVPVLRLDFAVLVLLHKRGAR
jgi:hypothetical protein